MSFSREDNSNPSKLADKVVEVQDTTRSNIHILYLRTQSCCSNTPTTASQGVLVDDDFVYDVHMYFHGVWVERRKDLLYSAGPGLLTVSGELYPQYGIVIKYNERIVKLP
jgi:hypothetical protein